MNKKHEPIDIQMDFGYDSPLYFRNPDSIIQTDQMEEVEACMRKVQHAVNEGYYAVGYLSYEAAKGLRPELAVHTGAEMPLVWFGIFESPDTSPRQSDKIPQAFKLAEWESSTDAADYENNIERIRQAIAEGETYQVNYTMRMKANFLGHARSLYEQLKEKQQGMYSAYLNTGDYQILSVSPELFFERKGNQLRTKPMKGTYARGKTDIEDQTHFQRLLESQKDRAENVMIVDLLRNDLGMIAATGSVTVSDLFAIEPYPTVWQMTSTITAQLKKDVDIVETFRALFPCGSITGAPKKKTMEKITLMEDEPRGVYCGSIGYITPTGDCVFNVAIRTAVINAEKEKITYGTGGGVTWDSTAKGEYEEAVLKSQIITGLNTDFSLLESLRLEEGHYPFLSLHLERIQASANDLDWSFSSEKMQELLYSYAKQHPYGKYKVRLQYHPVQGFSIDGSIVQELQEPVSVELAKEPIRINEPFSFHKTTARGVFEELRSFSSEKTFDVLLYNENNELLEFTIGNIVLEWDGVYVTPPVSLGLLPGVYRQHLLDRNIIQEKVLTISDIATSKRFWLINSVRGWVEVVFT
ncbi:para-aminobenzoate synthetase/4-amino-4-deoxychorismate lyase [Geomicrobium halophilum]|uniref:Para-aminobenzoate synthetase/4-amino-4-deoxychorismate lyase n=1 Tax=Geomicrobium halophilum TaxID=549000 RepID=A0A841Q0S1_9BACL|nr:aminodeoxychorismate synthase component I [Geomicrobium halophilum]MBB6449138.1 para-aminobenzoate synthetase/4-amino-4-deoxychorismate lyase [Geomicrobium halophilum]